MILAHRGGNTTTHGSDDRIITCFLTEMDGIYSSPIEHVFIIGVTREKHRLDPAVIRPGRLDIHLEIQLPDQESRWKILQGTLSKMPHHLNEQEQKEIVNRLQGCSTSEIINHCREAAIACIRRKGQVIVMGDFGFSMM